MTDGFLTAVAKGAGVHDIAKWNTDRKAKPFSRQGLRETTSQAKEELEFTGTPSFVIKGPGGTEPLGTPGSAEAIEAAIQKVG